MKKNILFILFLSFVKFSIACDCPPIKQTVEKQCENYAVIFEGKVDSVSAVSGKNAYAYFSVINLYKGKAFEETRVLFDCSTSCQLSFTPNETWIIYADYYKYGALEVKFCSRSRKFFSDSTKDYYNSVNGMSFKSELAFLQNNFGIHTVLSNNSIALQHEEEAQRLSHPSGVEALWLVGISFVVVTAFLYFFNKYFK